MIRKRIRQALLGAVLLFAVIQLVQPNRTNPSADPAASFEAAAKPAPEVAALFQRSCGDCHSNQTTWPWYSRVAPMSWLVADDVKEGRAHLNLSEWNLLKPEGAKKKLQAACKEVREGDMPLWFYLPMHPEARLSQADKEKICALSGPPPSQSQK